MAEKYSVGDYIWVYPPSNGEFDVPIGGKILAIESKKIRLKTDTDTELLLERSQFVKMMHSSSIKTVEDMIELGDLTQYSILRNLELRYSNQLIYTYTGSMLVAINPYEVLPIYTKKLITSYQQQSTHDLPPHIFAIGANSYNKMIETHSNQCIVISGESGAGKTESTKLILQYLAAVSGKHSWVEEQILEANPILEAFGNAKTVRNDNSSRFGKFIDISLTRDGSIEGAKIDQYLLEKSRIVSLNEGERNYHIFYSMLAGLDKDEKKKLELGDAKDYTYLNAGNALVCPGRNEAKEFADIRNAFKVLNFTEAESWNIFTLVAAVLHLGNVKFKGVTVNNLETSEISDSNSVNRIATLLEINKQELTKGLVQKTIYVSGEKVITQLAKASASESRDAFVKGIYGKLFIMLVDKINIAIDQTKSVDVCSIGVLDIFGFENFNVNSFEQLCINYANENLQQFFVQHIFKMEQEYYKQEGIKWENISYVDNQSVLDMIGMKAMNVMSLIDDESKFPKGTDLTMLGKLHNQHGKNDNYLKPKSDHLHYFGINHFAGKVNYQVPGFLEKNKDTFSQDLKRLLQTSTNPLLKKLYENDVIDDSGKRSFTLSSQFRSSLDILMRSLNACHPFFVRCIKPNEYKKPKLFDRALCVRQLTYSGMMETARIRQAGYPIRHMYKEFVHRYRFLGRNIPPPHKGDIKESARKICEAVFKKNEDFQFGHSRVFLKDHDNNYLEEERTKILARYIIVLQKSIRGWLCRRRYLALKKAALDVQKNWRARGYRSRFLKIRHGYHRIQVTIRSRYLAFDYQKIVRFRAHVRGYVTRKRGRFGKVMGIVLLRNVELLNLQNSGNKNYRQVADDNMKRRMAELNNEPLPVEDLNRDQKARQLVEDVFGFLNEETPASPVERANDSNAFLTRMHSKDYDAPPPPNYEDDLSDFNFEKYASTYFNYSINHQYYRKPLKSALHENLPTPDDIIAAQALWITILRFMGDLSEPAIEAKSTEPIMMTISQTLSSSFTNRKEFQEILRQEKANATLSKEDRQKLIRMTLKKKNKLLENVRKGLVEDTYAAETYDKWLSERRKNLDKLHFIIGHGILRPELRDEIFCQICKQLTHNPASSSHAKGWILLSLCVGCFPPSDRFINYLRAFIRNGPAGYAPYCEGRLNRTFKNGARSQPPSWLELNATKSKDPMTVDIVFLDNQTLTLDVDSATTAEEMCHQIAINLNLSDTFGFSVFIASCDTVMSLGSDSDHLMDAISQCEQYAKERGKGERSKPYKLFFRKEIFAPWHKSSEDSIATDLIYHQIISGIKHGEYRCRSIRDTAAVIAQQVYVENGLNMNAANLHARIGEYTPPYLVKKENLNQWETNVLDAYNKSQCVKVKKSPINVKEDVVKYAQYTWPILFSKFYEAIKISGPELPKNNLIIAINWTGIFLIDDNEQILLEFLFSEISYNSYEHKSTSKVPTFTLNTIRKEEYVFQSLDAKNLNNLISYIIDGLKKRSIYAVAVQDYKHSGENPSFLILKRGDLIILKNGMNGESLMNTSYGYGESNEKLGDFPTEHVQILATVDKPPAAILAAYKKEGAFDRYQPKNRITTLQRIRMYTLAHYAEEHFRSDRKATVSKGSVLTAARRHSREDLWKYTNEPIRQPLLKKVLENEALSKDAVSAFSAILAYMGDLPAPKPKISNEYTDLIFGPALQHDLLKDEIYCQIMRQLTFNKLSYSEERGWDLMYLATGSFICSAPLMIELNKFLNSRTHPVAELCAKRLIRCQKIGPRTYPPYSVEVEAIQHRTVEIYHKIYFPDDNIEAFEIDSLHTAKEIINEISQRLDLTTTEGFSLVVTMGDKVFTIPEHYFFYDFLYEHYIWMKKNKPTWNTGAQFQNIFQIFFMKTIWMNTVPGKDLIADYVFHYYQELPKYLRGYHKCSVQDAVRLAALILRVRFDNQTDIAMQALGSIIKEIIPMDIVRTKSNSEWKKLIITAYTMDEQVSVEHAKIKFLNTIYHWPTFGSSFFEAKQTSDRNYPDIVIIAINKLGVNVIHPHTKDILVTYDYSELNNWSSGNTFFQMSVGNYLSKTKFLCETPQASKMDQLIGSYVEYVTSSTQKRRPYNF